MSMGHQAPAGYGSGSSAGVPHQSPPASSGRWVSYTQMLTEGEDAPNNAAINQNAPLKPEAGLGDIELLMGEEETPGDEDIDIQYLLDALDRLEDASQAES